MIRSLYAACIARLGLSQALAAQLHRVTLQSVKNWCAGRSEPPDGVWSELRELEAAIVDRSEAIREAWEDAGEQREFDATIADDRGLMALADFVLSCEHPLRVQVRS